MTAVSLVNPYAPQPVAPTATELGYAAPQTTAPTKDTGTGNSMGNASDQSGQGAGNGTGTGGSQLTMLLGRARNGNDVTQQPTPKSVVEAQSEAEPAREFLERQAQMRAEGQAAEQKRIAEQAAAKAAEAKAAAKKAAEPAFELPNPLPTAPILQRDDT